MGSFGETIKRERELREISLRQVAEATKINLRFLEALEQNQFDILPGGLFNKGFIRAYATFIGVAAEAMVNSYLHEMAARDDQNALRPPAKGEAGMHRPADLPSRRSTGRGDAAAGPWRAPTIRFGSPTAGGGASPERPAPTGPAGPGPAVACAGSAAAGPRTAPDHAGPYPTNRPPAIHAIAEAAPPSKDRPRALLGVLLLVLGTALIFLVLGLISGRGPGVGHPEESVADSATSPVGDSAAGAPVVLDPGATLLIENAPGSVPTPTPLAAAAVPPPVFIPSLSPESPAGIPASTQRTTPGPSREAVPVGGDLTPAATPPERETIPLAHGTMLLEVTAATSTFINVVCDQENAIYSMLAAGETRTLTCRSVIKISAHDAGAIHLRVNGADCLPLGEPGARAFGYTIRIDDHERICQPAGRRFDGRS